MGCGHDDFESGGIGVKPVKRQVAHPRWLWLGECDPHTGVLAMAQFQASQLAIDHTGCGVGEKPRDAVPVGIDEGELRAGDGDVPCAGSAGCQAGRFDNSTRSVA
jgi:hypothetical protein